MDSLLLRPVSADDEIEDVEAEAEALRVGEEGVEDDDDDEEEEEEEKRFEFAMEAGEERGVFFLTVFWVRES